MVRLWSCFLLRKEEFERIRNEKRTILHETLEKDKDSSRSNSKLCKMFFEKSFCRKQQSVSRDGSSHGLKVFVCSVCWELYSSCLLKRVERHVPEDHHHAYGWAPGNAHKDEAYRVTNVKVSETVLQPAWRVPTPSVLDVCHWVRLWRRKQWMLSGIRRLWKVWCQWPLDLVQSSVYDPL